MRLAKLFCHTFFIQLATAPLFTTWAEENDWNRSQLSPTIIELAQNTTRKFHICLDRELRADSLKTKDPRAITDSVLKRCEHALSPIREAFSTENVPPEITNQYLRRKRNQAARSVLRAVMMNQSAATE